MEDFHGGLEFAVYKLFLLIDDRQTDGRTLLNVKSLSRLKILSLFSSLRGEGNKDKEYKSENILVLLNFRLQLPTWAK